MSSPIDREVAVFSAARRLPAGERAAYLDEVCAGDPALRQRVEQLLSASEEAGGFLQEPAPGAQRPADALADRGTLQVVAATGEKAGDRIGRYKLLQQIGEGGCGVVYMAEQEEPVRRRVALKVIKLGMDTRQVIARFEAERQALALMDHPNIAKVLEAGATDTGRPYFVMELVRGIKITHYCDENHLSTRERLDLFIKVAQAVQHAHQKGIIHRDLKPSNVLVADHDGVPVPKVIDFGIAKATTDQRLTDKTLFTAFEQFIGTPAYMSPEQARMSGLDIDTRTDIYSLGVLLYELLTGKTPFDAEDLLAAGLDAMRRTISEKEPARPSTRLGTMLEGELTTTAKHRHTDAPKLVHLLRGDLDWIVMKALEKDRTRRYETVNGLAADIERHLKNEPVVARPPSNLYRCQKLIKRNKLAFAAIGAVGAALLIGLAVSTGLLLKEREARRRAVAAETKAQTEAGKSEQVAAFLKKMLKGAGPSVALGRDATMLREILDETARTVSKELTNQAEVAVELCLILAETYHDLGLYKEMEGVARQSLQLARSRFGEDHESVALSLTSLGDALQHLGENRAADLKDAEKYSREGLEMIRKLLGKENRKVANALEHLANILATQGRLAEGEAMEREALAMYKRLLGNESPEVAKASFDLAITLSSQLQESRLAEAENLIREALATQQKLLGNNHPEIAKSLRILGTVLYYQGKSAEAEIPFRQSLELWSKLKANDRPEIVASLMGLTYVLVRQGNEAEAEARYREVLAMQRRMFGNENPDVSVTLNCLAGVLLRQGKLDEAEITCREALTIKRKLPGKEHADETVELQQLANVFEAQGKLTEAATMLREALARQRKLLGDEHFFVAWTLEFLAGVLQKQGELTEAETMFRETLAMRRKLPDHDYGVARSLENLASFLEEQGRLKEAEALVAEAVAYKRKVARPDTPESAAWVTSIDLDMTRSINKLGRFQQRTGKLEEAAASFRESLAIRRKIQGDQHKDVTSSLHQLDAVLAALASRLGDEGKLTQAEPVARERLAINAKQSPDGWRTFNARAELGGNLMAQRKFAEAEPLLLSGYEGMKQRAASIPPEGKVRLSETLQRLVQLYEATDRLDQAAEWKKKLAGPDNAEK